MILNGNILTEESCSLSFRNRAFAYGDGLFETLIGSKSQIYYFNDHLERLSASLKVLKIDASWINIEKISSEIKQLIDKNNIENLARIRILVWRKTGGLFSPDSNEAEYMVNAMEHTPTFTPKTKAVFFEEIKKSFSPISPFKTLSALHYVMAGIYKKDQNVDEVILLDTENNISETLNSNIFWIKEGKVFTPSILTGCIDGVMKKQIAEFLKNKNILLIEGCFSKKDLLDAEFVFTSNVTGVIPILSIEQKLLQDKHEIFDLISKEFNRS